MENMQDISEAIEAKEEKSKFDQRKFNQEWDKKNTTQIKMKLNNNTDKELLEYLKTVPNKQGYIKRLILDDMERKKAADKK